MIVPGMFVCSSFLISVCMFIGSKALLISSATVIVRAGGAIWLNPFDNRHEQDATCTRLHCYRHLHKLCRHNPCPQRWGPYSIFWTSRPSLPAAWLALLLTNSGDVESNLGPTTQNKHTPVIWMCDLCHKQINKKQTSTRCNHTHNTHWVHLKCTHIQQRQYKPDWRCTIHTPTQNVTTTPSTDNTTPHHKQTTTHSQTTINQRTKSRN